MLRLDQYASCREMKGAGRPTFEGYYRPCVGRRRSRRLYRLAEAQAGYFTARQALAAGMDRSTLRHHVRPGGRYERVHRGLYRLRHFPTSSHEHVVAAWIPLREAGAVVSHESALELHDLSDVIPVAVHLSLPRAKRGQRPRPGVRLHTLERPPGPSEVRTGVGYRPRLRSGASWMRWTLVRSLNRSNSP
jgi:hypothetical protein